MIKPNPEYNKILADALAKADEYKPLITSNNEWISVDERLPKEDGQYLTYSFDEETDDDMIVTAYFFKRLSNKKNRWVLDNDSGNYVTHWMPLPEPPKGE